jgi:Ca-activated chloride channel family protein
MTFGEPRALWLLLLAPPAAWLLARFWRRRLRADAAWAARGLWDRLLPSFRPRRIPLSIAALVLALLGTALALALPRWGAGEERVERRGVDVVFLLDSSLSMGAMDEPPSRLFVAKSLIRRMAQEMPGDRIGLVQSEGEGVVLSPLTLDGAVIDMLLDTIDPGSLPTPGTEIASGLDTALRLFGEERRRHRALILLSDGEDHGGGLAGRIDHLKEAGVTVYALGVGTPEGAPLPVPGKPGEYKRDRDGNRVESRLEEAGLRALAKGTGGVYRRATSAAADVAPILRQIRHMEQTRFEGAMVNTRRERFQWPLALAAGALLCHLLVRPFGVPRRRQEPGRAR